MIINNKDYIEIISYQHNFSFLPKFQLFFTMTINSKENLFKLFKEFNLLKTKIITIENNNFKLNLKLQQVFISEINNQIIFLLERKIN